MFVVLCYLDINSFYKKKGGAERLVVDAAVGIQSKGHNVVMYTSHHDRNHCFEETRDGTLQVRVHGDSLPRDLFGRFYIVFAILRQLVLVYWIIRNEKETYDIIFVDQLSACVPVLKWFCPAAQVLFYCHFPDKLLTRRDSKLKELYRVPIDKLEELSTGMADSITVNSQFTAGMFRRSFPSILKKPRVLYPPINFNAYDKKVDLADPSVQLVESYVYKNTRALIQLLTFFLLFKKKVIKRRLFQLIDLKRRRMLNWH